MQMQIPEHRQIFFYIVRGSVLVNDVAVSETNLVEFAFTGQQINLSASTDALVLICHAAPYGEPIVSNGPFVMNTAEEIRQAYEDTEPVGFRMTACFESERLLPWVKSVKNYEKLCRTYSCFRSMA